MTSKKSSPLSASQLEQLGKLLLERRATLLSDANSIEEEALNHASGSGSGELSSVPFHMADVGSENYEREFALGLLENEKEELRQIDEALARLREGKFGDCEVCGERIPTPRLRALPYARMCIDCKREHEQG